MNWEHFKTFLWLRSRLSRNQWRKGGSFAAVLRWVLLVGGILLSAGGAIGGFLLGWLALGKVGSSLIAIIWGGLLLVFLFIWLLGIAAEIQRSEAIDLQRLLHLPVSLQQVFFLNYLASLVTPSLAFALPAAFGLAAGLALSRGVHLLWLFPMITAVVFAVSAWTYCLRGWLVALMVNKRRKRAIIMIVTAGAVLLGQIPNLAFNNPYTRDYFRRHVKDDIRAAASAQPEAQGASTNSLARGADGSSTTAGSAPVRSGVDLPWYWAGLASLGLLMAGVQGLRRGYRLTLQFYQGSPRRRTREPGSPETVSGSAAPARRTGVTVSSGRTLIERRLPWVSDQTSAMTMAFLRSALRAPEVKMALIMPVMVMGLLAFLFLTRSAVSASSLFTPFLLVGIVGFSLFGVIQLIANMFGYDRHGFRALVLTPVPRRQILFAKNLALLPLTAGMGAVLVPVMGLIWKIPLLHLLAGFMQLLVGYVLLSAIGNYTSIRVAYRVAPGSLKPTKLGAKNTVLMMLMHLLFPLALLPLLVPPTAALVLALFFGWPGAVVNAALSGLLLGCSLVFYSLSLGWTGALLAEQEKEILQKVTATVE